MRQQRKKKRVYGHIYISIAEFRVMLMLTFGLAFFIGIVVSMGLFVLFGNLLVSLLVAIAADILITSLSLFTLL